RMYLDHLYAVLVIKPFYWLTGLMGAIGDGIVGIVNATTWLYMRLAKALAWVDENIVDGAVNGIAWLYQWDSRIIKWFDDKIVDGLVNAIAWAYVLASRLSRVFDLRIIDGAVNGLGALSLKIGGRLRTVQSGEVQWYQRLIVGAAVIVVGIFVILYVLST
ncbi:MAG: hypothetical protein FWE46_05580, partial [Coriobacteriia bacterium]|nr:hypothetical protein [Coriobacteriia bacterium]